MQRPNEIDFSGYSPLMLAIVNDSESAEVEKVLIQHGADVNAVGLVRAMLLCS